MLVRLTKWHWFYTVEERNKLIRGKAKSKIDNNEKFTYYDIQPTDYDKKYIKIKEDIGDGFDYLRDRDIVYACKRLESLSKNMHDDLGFITAIMAVPLYKIDNSLKSDFWNDYQALVKSYLDKSETQETNN